MRTDDLKYFLAVTMTLVAVGCLLGSRARGASLSDLDEITQTRLLYAILDQRDNLKMAYEDALSEQRTGALETESHRVSLQKMEELFSEGSVSETSLLSMRLTVQLDSLQQDLTNYKLRALKQKLSSVQALESGNVRAFLMADRDTNDSMLSQYEEELKKAQATAAFEADHYAKIHAQFAQGTISWALDHGSELNTKKADDLVTLWKRKMTEQSHQLQRAKETLTAYEEEHDPHPNLRKGR